MGSEFGIAPEKISTLQSFLQSTRRCCASYHVFFLEALKPKPAIPQVLHIRRHLQAEEVPLGDRQGHIA